MLHASWERTDSTDSSFDYVTARQHRHGWGNRNKDVPVNSCYVSAGIVNCYVEISVNSDKSYSPNPRVLGVILAHVETGD